MDDADDTLIEIPSDEDEEEITSLDVVPEYSKRTYMSVYETFCKWKAEKNYTTASDLILLEYFKEISTKYKKSTLTSTYSKLKTTLKVFEHLKLNRYTKVNNFINRICRGYKPKQSDIFTQENINDFLRNAPDIKFLPTKVALIIGVLGRCKSNELHDLKISDLQDLQKAYAVTVTNPVTKKPRKFYITDNYYEICQKYIKHRSHFPDKPVFQQYRNGKITQQNIGVNTLKAMGRKIAIFLKLPNEKDYSSMSIRKVLARSGQEISQSFEPSSIITSTGNEKLLLMPVDTEVECQDVQDFEEDSFESETLDDSSMSDSNDIASKNELLIKCENVGQEYGANNDLIEQSTTEIQEYIKLPPLPPIECPAAVSITTLDSRPTVQLAVNSETDEFHTFGMSVASQLRNMPLEAALRTESKIQQLITEMRLRIRNTTDTTNTGRNLDFNDLLS